MARPEKWKDEYVRIAEHAMKLGATDHELAEMLGVCARTIYNWQATRPEFASALNVGKKPADDRVERSLYARANGYTFDSVKIFQYEGVPVEVPYTEHVPPDTTACIFWLKNRRPDLWRDKRETELSGSLDLVERLERARVRAMVDDASE